MTRITAALALALGSALCAGASAQDVTSGLGEPGFGLEDEAAARPIAPTAGVAGRPALSFSVRGGVRVRPEFPGSDDYEVAPDLGLSFGSVRVGRFAFGDPDPFAIRTGPQLRGSFRYVGERDSDDYDDLRGLDDVDDAIELGVGLAYRQPNYQVFGDVRYGVTGHDSFVGEVGADVFVRPSDRLTLSAGPRVFFGSDEYADTYFGVDEGEAAASALEGAGLDAFDAEGGALSAGLEIGARYRLTENLDVEGAVTYDRLIGDAEDSPITEAGSADQYSVRLGLTRRINFGF